MAAPVKDFLINTSFYTTDERYEVCEINGSKFALFFKAYDVVDVNIDLPEYNIVIMSPLISVNNIAIKAINILVLAEMQANCGHTHLVATGKFICFRPINSFAENIITHHHGHHLIYPTEEKLEAILSRFKAGISQKHGLAIVEALKLTVNFIEDPLKSDDLDATEAFAFLRIPTTL